MKLSKEQKEMKKDRSWIYDELFEYGYSYEKLGEMFGYSKSGMYQKIKGNRYMEVDLLSELLKLIVSERKKHETI